MRKTKVRSPLRYALFCALVYAIASGLWIRYTTILISSMSTSIHDFERLVALKGYLFVVVTSGLFFAFAYSVSRNIFSSANDLVQSQQRLLQAERDAITGLVASSVAHDFTNLLTILRLNTERLKTLSGLPESAVDPIGRLDRGVDRLTELAKRMREAGRQVFRDKPRSFDVTTTIEETLALLRGHLLLKGCAIQIDAPSSVMAIGYPILIHQLMMNLVLNAAEAANGKGRILIRANRFGRCVSLEVHDDGPGIKLQDREQVFEAFYTTKQHGSGLGLMSVKSCVDIHEGSVSVRESELGGAAFSVLLPDLDESQMARLKLPESLNKIRTSPESICLEPLPTPV